MAWPVLELSNLYNNFMEEIVREDGAGTPILLLPELQFEEDIGETMIWYLDHQE